MSNSRTATVNPPAVADVTPSASSSRATRPTAPAAVEVVGGFEQISKSQRVELLKMLDGHIVPESAWWKAYLRPGSSGSPAFDAARAREQRTAKAA